MRSIIFCQSAQVEQGADEHADEGAHGSARMCHVTVTVWVPELGADILAGGLIVH